MRRSNSSIVLRLGDDMNAHMDIYVSSGKGNAGGSVLIRVCTKSTMARLKCLSGNRCKERFDGKRVINLTKQADDLQFVCTNSDIAHSNKVTHVTMLASAYQIVYTRSTKYA